MKAGETRSSTLEVKAKKAVIKEPRKGQNLWYERDQFLPIWRSVLTCRFIVKMFPSYAPDEDPPYNQHGGTRKKLNGQRLSEVRLGLLCSLESKPWKLASDPKIASAYQSRRPFGTAALTVLKMLKRAR
uniref:Uncharacterized protein n=1 Tax=Avena sativa TaxID=4498 RepID=A0ACD5ZH72_AVESA